MHMTSRNVAAGRRARIEKSTTPIARRRICLVLLLALVLWPPVRAAAAEPVAADPSGQWKSLHGVLSLMLAGDALSFSYSAVFGSTGHLCDGAGVAGLVGNGQYHYVDGQGTVAFRVDESGVKMLTVDGIASFCGAYWPGDTFSRDGYEAPTRCTVTRPKAHFHVVMPPPPVERKAYVLQGDRVEAAPTCFEGGDPYVFARFKGPRVTTVGLLPRDALECRE